MLDIPHLFSFMNKAVEHGKICGELQIVGDISTIEMSALLHHCAEGKVTINVYIHHKHKLLVHE